MAFSIKKLEDTKPDSDLTNLGELNLVTLKSLLKSERGGETLSKIKEKVFEIARKGKGVNLNTIPNPLSQNGLECQTMAIINGIISNGGTEYLIRLGGVDTVINRVRSNALQAGLSGRSRTIDIKSNSTIDSEAHLKMGVVAEEFPKLGIPLGRYILNVNPIKATEQIFRSNRFLGIVNDLAWHAYIILPLENPTEEQFALRLDSLGGRKETLSLDTFLQILIDKGLTDNYYCFELSISN